MHGPPLTAVVRRIPMVPHHVIVSGRNLNHRVASPVAMSRRQVRFSQNFIVDDHPALLDFHPVTGQPDDSLDVRFRRIAGKAEDYDVTARNGLKLV